MLFACGNQPQLKLLNMLLCPGKRVTCDFMLPELVVLEGLLHRLDGCVVDVQQLLHRSYTERM